MKNNMKYYNLHRACAEMAELTKDENGDYKFGGVTVKPDLGEIHGVGLVTVPRHFGKSECKIMIRDEIAISREAMKI